MQGMQMDGGDARLLQPVTERIIGCAFRVADALGHGFVEKVIENALAQEMRKCGLGAVQQRGIVVFYGLLAVWSGWKRSSQFLSGRAVLPRFLASARRTLTSWPVSL